MARPKKEKPNHSSGMYVVRVTVGHNFDGTAIRKAFYSSKSKADARLKAEEYKINQAVYEVTGENLTPQSMTFGKWAMEWLDTYKKGTVKEHTYNFTYRVNVEKYLIPFFGKSKLVDIKQVDIQKYFNKVDNNGDFLAKSTLEKHKMILKSIFDKAIDNDYCYKNPVKDIKMPNTATVKIREVYSSDEAIQVEEYAKNHSGGLGIVVILNTGVRRSELLGLKWNDIDFDKNRIRIERAVTQTVGEVIIGDPKTETSKRTIPVSKDFLEYLQTIQKESEYVIAGEYDNPKSPNSYSAEFKKIMDQMQLNTGLNPLEPHELRHTYGTLLREKGVDIYTIQKVMGHSDISITAKIYVHNDIEVLQKQMLLDDE